MPSVVGQNLYGCQNIRTDGTLIISCIKPHRVVHVDPIRPRSLKSFFKLLDQRWITTQHKDEWMDECVLGHFCALSRVASTSKAKEKQIPLGNIMAAAMWMNALTFAKFYDEVIVKEDSRPGLADAIFNV